MYVKHMLELTFDELVPIQCTWVLIAKQASQLWITVENAIIFSSHGDFTCSKACLTDVRTSSAGFCRLNCQKRGR